MKLSQKESDILAAVELTAQKSIHDIRRQTGYRDHTIRYCLNSLEQRGIISFGPIINKARLGYVEHNIFFSTGSQTKKEKDTLLRTLMNEDAVTFVAALGSDFPLGIGISTHDIFEVREILLKLGKKFPGLFYEKQTTAQYSVTLFPRQYLSRHAGRTQPVVLNRSEVVTLDPLDDKILVALASTTYRSRRELAKILTIPLSTLEFRIRKLESQKVIVGYRYSIDSFKLGMLTYKLLIYAKGVDATLASKLFTFCRSHPNVVLLFECLGNWDFEINVEVDQAEGVVSIVQEIYDACGSQINSIKTLPKFRDLKNVEYSGLHK